MANDFGKKLLSQMLLAHVDGGCQGALLVATNALNKDHMMRIVSLCYIARDRGGAPVRQDAWVYTISD